MVEDKRTEERDKRKREGEKKKKAIRSENRKINEIKVIGGLG